MKQDGDPWIVNSDKASELIGVSAHVIIDRAKAGEVGHWRLSTKEGSMRLTRFEIPELARYFNKPLYDVGGPSSTELFSSEQLGKIFSVNESAFNRLVNLKRITEAKKYGNVRVFSISDARTALYCNSNGKVFDWDSYYQTLNRLTSKPPPAQLPLRAQPEDARVAALEEQVRQLRADFVQLEVHYLALKLGVTPKDRAEARDHFARTLKYVSANCAPGQRKYVSGLQSYFDANERLTQPQAQKLYEIRDEIDGRH